MVKGTLEHVGIAVRDFDATAAVSGRLGLKVVNKQVLEARGVVRGYLSDGQGLLELLQPLRDDTIIGRFVAERGEDLHHLCFAVDDLHSAVADLAADGYELTLGSPWRGSRGMNAYLRHESGSGVVIELVEKDR